MTSTGHPGEGRPALLVFLTTTCAPCAPFWEHLRSSPLPGELGVDLVVVTPSRPGEDEAEARRLLPPGARLHMASGTWFEYGVGRAGSVALVLPGTDGRPPWEGGGTVVGSVSVPAPEEVPGLVRRWLGRRRTGSEQPRG